MALTRHSPSLIPLAQALRNLRRDVDQPAPRRDFEPEFFAKRFQGRGIEQKVTKATKEKPPELNRFVTFVSFCFKNQETA
jgi:hypothetical protein